MFWLLFLTSSDRALHMDVLPRITRQLVELFREMSPAQRVTLIAMPVALLLGFGGLVFLNTGSDFRELSFGKAFAGDEMTSAEQALIAAGLSGFRREGQRLLAPGNEIDRYNAALLQSDALPGDLGTQLLKQYETLGPFSTDRQRQQMKEALLLQELGRMIKAVPDVEDARVVIASSERRVGWNQKPRTSANVMVKPRRGREISAMLVNSLKHVVASMVPDLNPTDVTIFDVSSGHAFTGESADDPADSRLQEHAQALTRQYELRIHRALSYIPNVGVTAQVDPDAHRAQVSVSIPRDYIRNVVAAQIAKGDHPPEPIDPGFVEEEVLSKVEQIVGRLIPADSPSNAISVTCVDRLDHEVPQVTSRPLKEQLVAFAYKWGSSVAIGVLTLIALWMMRSRARAVAAPREDVGRHANEEMHAAVASIEPLPIANPSIEPDRIELLREEIKAMFASRPLMQPADPETARELFERTFDRNEVELLEQRTQDQVEADPFAYLHNRHPDDIRRLIEDEHPQTISVICAQLPPNLAAQVLAGFGAEPQGDILGRVARLGPTDPEVLFEIAGLLRDRLGRMPIRSGGLARAADMLREAPRQTSRSVLESLETKDAKMAGTLRRSMFLFNDLSSLDDAELQLVLRKTDHFAWAIALKGSPESLRQHIFRNMSVKMAKALKEEINSVGPLRLSEITDVQQKIAEAILVLDSQNEIELPRRPSRLSTVETV